MYRGKVNPTQHLPWWLRETTKRTQISFGQHQDLNSELSECECSVVNFDLRYALFIQNLITHRTSQWAGAGIRASIFNRWNDATVRLVGNILWTSLVSHTFIIA